VRGSHIRLGHGSAAVTATHKGRRYRTVVTTTRGVGARTVYLGVTLPRGAKAVSVRLDGHAAHSYTVRHTNRGDEVVVRTRSGHHTLVVTRAG